MKDREIPKFLIEKIVRRALEEDVGSQDITSEACIDYDATATAQAVARHELIACGAAVAKHVFFTIDPELYFKTVSCEGALLKPGDVLWQVSGRTRAILMGERVALNFVQRMCGIATKTRSFVKEIPPGCSTRIADTRKTTPGLRALERYAVAMGGGFNHRDNLNSSILIKDNHIAACGSLASAIQRARAYAPHTCKIECEVDTLEELDEAIKAKADIILLDNMPTEMIFDAVRRTNGKAKLEASGGITLERIAELALTGVDIISIGALTHSAPAADIGLDFCVLSP